jgi:hypothetical protein
LCVRSALIHLLKATLVAEAWSSSSCSIACWIFDKSLALELKLLQGAVPPINHLLSAPYLCPSTLYSLRCWKSVVK